MAGILQFTLGLATGGFLRGVGGANAALRGFIVGAVGLESVLHGVEKQIAKGAGLEQLSKRTGESVASLYAIEKGFKAVGLSADSVGTVIFQMQKALGGFNEMGEPTKDIFAGIGLGVEDLKQLNGAQQLEAITKALAGLGKEEAAVAAGKIFGRAGAGDMLQAARGGNEFAEAMRNAAATGAVFGNNAGAFEKLERSLGRLRNKFDSIYLGIAVGVTPALQKMADILNAVDLSKIGIGIGKYLNVLTQAFTSGHLSDFLSESLRLGLEAAVIAAPAILEKLGVFLLKVFQTPLTYLQAGLEYAIDQAVNNPTVRKILFAATGGASEVAFSALGLGGGGDRRSFQDIFKERMEHGIDFFAEGLGLNEMDADADERLKAAGAAIKDRVKDFFEFISGLTVDSAKAGEQKSGALSGNGSKSKPDKPEASALEKMGFVLNSGISAIDFHRTTAENTGKIHSQLKLTHTLLSQRLGNMDQIVNKQ